MLSLPTKQEDALRVLSSIIRFSHSPDNRGMLEWLEQEQARLDKANRHELDPILFRQRQGACQALEVILTEAEEADQKAEKIRAALLKPKGV